MVSSRAPLRIGVLGAAAIAPAAIVRPARRTPAAQLVAIAARDRAHAARFASKHGIPTVHADYRSLLADQSIEAVYIPLPNGLHGTWTLAAIDAGKHVLCEKPFAANASEARAVADAAAGTDLVVMEAFHWRYHPLAQRAITVAATELGPVRRIDAAFAFPLLKRHDIRWSRALAGGGLLDAGCYAVHQIRAVAQALDLGEPTVGSAVARLTQGGVDRALRGELRFDSGLTASMRCGLLDPRSPIAIHLSVEGDDGRLVVRNPVLPHLFGHMAVRTRQGRRTEWAARTPSYDYQLAAFVAAVRDHAEFPTTPGDAVATMHILDELQRAAGIEPPVPTRLS